MSEHEAPDNPVDMIREIAAAGGGKVESLTVMDDGHGFATVSFPLPADHWLTAEGINEPPAKFRTGLGTTRDELRAKIIEAARYAVRASTNNGADDDFDPDAMVNNMVIGMLGYYTSTGLSEIQ